tara:strand:- start:529 stop:1722 length:1194 start_codon:yes stop_codon:yes gene_type:complete
MKKRSNPKIEAMKERSLIVENERKNLHTPKFYINEQEEEIKQPAGDPYEYKKDESGYYFKKRDEENWKKTYNSAVKSLFDDGEQKPVTKSSGESKSSGKPKNIKGFQQWVINTKGDKSILGKGGDSGYGDDGIWGDKTAAAWNKYGKEYQNKKPVEKTKKDTTIFSTNANPKFIIDTNEISSTDTVTLSCKAGTEHCAQWVNNYSDKVDVVGNAWTAHDNSKLGTTVWSAYKGLDDDTIEDIVEIYKDIDKQGGANDNKTDSPIITKIKDLQDKLINKRQPNVSNLKADDIVGLYYEPSGHHEKAFEEAADFGKGYFPNGEPGETLGRGNSFAFNTHVGIVGAEKDGEKIIFHNVGGKLISSPAKNEDIVWVKRIGNSTSIKDEEGNWYSDIISYFS